MSDDSTFDTSELTVTASAKKKVNFGFGMKLGSLRNFGFLPLFLDIAFGFQRNRESCTLQRMETMLLETKSKSKKLNLNKDISTTVTNLVPLKVYAHTIGANTFVLVAKTVNKNIALNGL